MVYVGVIFRANLKWRHVSRLLVYDRYDVIWRGNRGDASRIGASSRAHTSRQNRYFRSTWQAQKTRSSLRHMPIYTPSGKRENIVACLSELLSLSLLVIRRLAAPVLLLGPRASFLPELLFSSNFFSSNRYSLNHTVIVKSWYPYPTMI